MCSQNKTIIGALLLFLIAGHIVAKTPLSRTEKITLNATLYKKHQVCLADVRNTAGRITALNLIPDVSTPEALDNIMMCIYWDGSQTPFIACSVRVLLDLLEPEGIPQQWPDLIFSRGFRIFAECPTGQGGTLKGEIRYERTVPPATTQRVRFDPGLGFTTPQLEETVSRRPTDLRRGRGESLRLPDAGFESGELDTWRDISWEKGGFRIFPGGTEGVIPYAGKYMAGVVAAANVTRNCRGLARVGGLVPGYRYRLSAWINTYSYDKKPVPENAKARLGINTTGAFLTTLYPEEADLWTTDYSHPPFYFPHCWGARNAADSQDHWSVISVATRARGEVASLFLQGSQLFGHPHKWCFFDDIITENIPIPMGSIEGCLIDDRNNPVKEAWITTDPWGYGARTGGDGQFQIKDVPEGIYTLTAGKGTDTVPIRNLRVMADRSVRVELTFAKSPSGKIIKSKFTEGQNLLINSGFESGDTAGWERAYTCHAMKVVGVTRRFIPPCRNYMFGGEHVFHGADIREIIYQRVPVPKNTMLMLSGLICSHSVDNPDDQTWCRLVVDPTGGTDFKSASPRYHGSWNRLFVPFKAEADRVTVGIEMRQAPRKTGGMPGDEGIIGVGQSRAFRGDYHVYYCDQLSLIPVKSGDSTHHSIEKIPPPQVHRISRIPAPNLPDMDTAEIVLPDGKTTLELIRIKAGQFLMGADSRSGWARDDEWPRHRVSLDTYWIGKYEVTNAQYRAFCDHQNYPYPPDPAFSGIPPVHRDKAYYYGDYFTQMPQYPVVNVSWEDACAFCAWAGLRLPTEAEWEMAARGYGDSLKTYPWGEQTNPAWKTRNRANTCINSPPDWYIYTAPVGRFESHKRIYNVGRSVFGVCDMGGNVREWCRDWYGPYSAEPQTNPLGPAAGTHKVLRSGCWQGTDYGVMTRCSYRFSHPPKYYPWGTTGFRVAVGKI